jgi:flagellar motility protein MotE (MotC chaperone)
MQELKNQLEQKNTNLSQLEADIQTKNSEIDNLVKEVEFLREQTTSAALTEEEHSQKLKELSDLYGSMTASKSAPIIENLTIEEAVLVLSEMQLDKRGKILEKMDPKKAADVSILLKDVIPTKDREIAALQERISLLTKALSDQQKKGISNDDLAVAYSTMPPDKAAEVLVEIYKNSPSEAILILSSMDRQAMSLIMSEMPTATVSAITSKMLKKSS